MKKIMPLSAEEVAEFGDEYVTVIDNKPYLNGDLYECRSCKIMSLDSMDDFGHCPDCAEEGEGWKEHKRQERTY